MKLGLTNATEVTAKLSSNLFGDSNDGSKFLHNMLVINAQVLRLRKAFANNFSANVKL